MELMIDAESAHTAACLEYDRCTKALASAAAKADCSKRAEYEAALLVWEAAVDEMNVAFRTYDNAYRLWAIS